MNIRRVSKNDELLTVIPKKHRLIEERARISNLVVNFLELDENSRMNPGKRDCVAIEGEDIQTRILNDYMQVMFERLLGEYPDEKIGRTTFYELRPKHILPSSQLQSQSCLCQIHENMGLVLQAIRAYSSVKFSTNPDVFNRDMSQLLAVEGDLNAKQYWENARVEGVEDKEEVPIRQWKRVIDKSDSKVRTKCVQNLIPYFELLQKGSVMFDKFQLHSERIKSQYKAIKHLKNTLKPNEIVVHMDFAENYSCKGERMTQSSYWNPTQVTLHPVVVYYRDATDGEVKHRTLIYISSQNKHNATMVIAIIKSLMLVDIVDIIKDQKITHCNYVTDGPSSQYRNRFQAFIVSIHKEAFGITCSWHFFETGHGKCVCDGVGGVMKRTADQATKHGEMITNGAEFFSWAETIKSKMSFVYISKAAYLVSEKDMKGLELALKPIPGTMDLHCMKPDEGKLGSINYMTISCTCDDCRGNKLHVCSNVWLNASCLKTGKALQNAKEKGGSFFTQCSVCPILCVCYLSRPDYCTVEGDEHGLTTDDDVPLTEILLSSNDREEVSDEEEGYCGPARDVERSVDMLENQSGINLT